MNRRLVALGVLLVALAAGGAWWRYAQQTAADAQLLRASGMIEATEVAVSSEVGGRLLDGGPGVREHLAGVVSGAGAG